jgi:hypothetical protein
MIASFKTSFYLALVGVLMLGLFSMSPADAAAAKKAPPKPVDPRILIKSVDVAKGQIVITYMRDKRNATYTIDDTTVLTVQGHPGTIKDIEVGMQVFGYVERDEYSLNSLDVKTADAAPVAPK